MENEQNDLNKNFSQVIRGLLDVVRVQNGLIEGMSTRVDNAERLLLKLTGAEPTGVAPTITQDAAAAARADIDELRALWKLDGGAL